VRGSTTTEGTRPVLRLRKVDQPPRVWSPLDAFLYNSLTTNVTIAFGTLFIAGASFFFPIKSLTIAIVIAGVFCLAQALVYAFLISSLPKNGGDYVFQRRLLSPWAGTTFAFIGAVVGGAMWMAIAGWFASRVAIGPFLVLLGVGLRSDGVTAVGQWVMSSWGVIILGLVATLWAGLVNTRGMRVYARLQRRLTVVGFVALSLLVAYLALTRLNLNESTYRAITYRAAELGYLRMGRSGGFEAALRLLPLVAFGLIYPGLVSFQAGELKGAGRFGTQCVVNVGSKLASIVFALVLLPLPILHVGEELFGAIAYLGLHDPRSFWVLAPRLFSLPAASWFPWLMLSSLAVAINTWLWIWVPSHSLAASRVMLAMTWDHLLPQWVGKLDAKSEAPSRAIGIFSVVCVFFVIAYAYLGLWNLAVHVTLVCLITFSVTCVAAAAFPFARRELYRESTSAPYQLLRVPLITVAGVAFVGFAAFLAWRYLSFGLPMRAGTAVTMSTASTLAILGVIYGCALGLHVLFSTYRRSHEGTDVEVFYRVPYNDEA
jgi:amino acid transporter